MSKPKEKPPVTTIPRPHIVTGSNDLEAADLPEHVTVAVRELVGAAKEGLLALSVGVCDIVRCCEWQGRSIGQAGGQRRAGNLYRRRVRGVLFKRMPSTSTALATVRT
jgi:hypothetical protein